MLGYWKRLLFEFIVGLVLISEFVYKLNGNKFCELLFIKIFISWMYSWGWGYFVDSWNFIISGVDFIMVIYIGYLNSYNMKGCY